MDFTGGMVGGAAVAAGGSILAGGYAGLTAFGINITFDGLSSGVTGSGIRGAAGGQNTIAIFATDAAYGAGGSGILRAAFAAGGLALSRIGAGGANAADSAAVDAAAGGSARLRYMGGTPDRFSRTGAEVVERMRGDGLIVGDGPLLRGNPNDLQLVTDNGLVRIDSTIDMAHQTDAVSWWNSTGRFYGAKAPEVRQFMLDSDNYILQPRSINRSEGALLRPTYLPPEPPTFTTLKR